MCSCMCAWYFNVYKKCMSAEGISGRKPYGLRTHMIERRGWKRLEANRVRIPKSYIVRKTSMPFFGDRWSFVFWLALKILELWKDSALNRMMWF